MDSSIRWVMGGVAVAGLLAMGCSSSTAGGAGKPEIKKDAAAVTPCGPDGMIDDGEDQNNQVLVQDGRSGYWYTYMDEAGSTVTPTAGAQGGTFVMSEGGANGSQYSARMFGKVGSAGTVYVGMGFNLTDPKDAYDASRFGGVKFYAKKGGGSAGRVRLKMPDQQTDPQGGRCQECFNDFGVTFEVTESWTEYVLPFYLSKQEPDWGDVFSMIVPSALYGLQWQTNVPGAAFDIYVDDVSFVGCDSATAAPAGDAPAAAAPPAAPPPPAPTDPAAAPSDPGAVPEAVPVE